MQKPEWVLLLVLALAPTGCSPALIPMEKEEMARLKSEPKIHVVMYQPARFNYSTAGDGFAVGVVGALTGGLGGAAYGLAMEARADAFVRKYSLEDPAGRARETFIGSLADQIDVARFIPAQDILAEDGVEALQKKFGAGVVLDFQTKIWGLMPAGPFSVSNYQVPYAVRSRLLRLSDGRVLWQGYCRRTGSDSDSRATWDEFTANSGALLKKKLGEAAEACVKELVAQFLEKQK
jgi:hypothetical protein